MKQLKCQQLIYGLHRVVMFLIAFSSPHNIFSPSFSAVLHISSIRTICCSNALPFNIQLSSFNFTAPKGKFPSKCTDTEAYDT